MTRPQAAESRGLALKENNWKKPRREFVLILVLAAVTVLLGICGYRLTAGGFSFGNSASGEPAEMAAEVAELTSPSVIAAGQGDGVYLLLDQQEKMTADSGGSSVSGTAWRIIRSTLGDFLSGRTRAALIGKSDYAEIAAGGTLEAVFSCDLPFDEFMEYNELKTPGGAGITSFCRITLSAADGGTVCFYDGREDRYYRVTSRKDSDSLTGEWIDSIRAAAEEKASAADRRRAADGVWYGKETLLPALSDASGQSAEAAEAAGPSSGSSAVSDGAAAAKKEEAGNDAAGGIVPASGDFTPEYDAADRESVSRLEEIFFPQGMDFIQKLEHPDGSLTYMYGTTEKVLKVEANGGFTFSSEKKGSRWTPGFYPALSKAVSYINKKGGWPGAPDGVEVRLLSADPIERESESLIRYKSSGWRFTFGLEVLGLPLVYEEDDEIQMYIDVYGSGVTEYHRDLPALTGASASGSQTAGAASQSLNSTSSETTAAASGEESASPSVQQAEALSLEKVIRADSAVLLTALADKGTDLEKMTAEELEAMILGQISAADLLFLRIRDQSTVSSTGNSRVSSGSGLSPGSSGSSPAAGDRDRENSSGTTADDWDLIPAWKITLNKKVFQFDAVTGKLLQNS